MKNFYHLSRFAWDRFFIFRGLMLAVLLSWPLVSSAQFKFRQPPNRQDPSALEERDQAFIWQQFLQNRNLGPFSLSGTLVYRPAAEPSRSFSFELSCNWNSKRQVTALELVHPDGRQTTSNVVLIDGCPFQSVQDGGLQRLPEEQLDDPLLEDLPFTWSDLLMPYLMWPDMSYVGPDRYLGRPAHRYALNNPDADAFPARVVVTLDEDYAALLRASLFDKDGRLVKRIRVGGFKQFGDDWMFSSLFWENRVTRSSVRLQVSSFSYGN